MQNEEILQRAIEKAEGNGFIYLDGDVPKLSDWKIIAVDEYIFLQLGEDYGSYIALYEIIFSHEFATAFWGDTDDLRYFCPFCSCYRYSGEQHPERCPYAYPRDKIITLSKFHLQQMVVREEPLKYIEKFL